MRLAILSDIHANSIALQAVIEDIQQSKIDEVVFLGDLLMTGPTPYESYILLKNLEPLIWLQGNTDNWLEEIDEEFVPKDEKEIFIKKLYDYAIKYLNKEIELNILSKKIYETIMIEDLAISFCHGSPVSFSQGLSLSTDTSILKGVVESIPTNVLFCGHTHIPTIIQLKDKLIINFGSISIPGNDFDKSARYGIIEIKDGIISYSFKSVKYDIDLFFKEMRLRDYPGIEQLKKKFGY